MARVKPGLAGRTGRASPARQMEGVGLSPATLMPAQDVIGNLRELATRTSTADGAQRLAWGPVWRDAREWFNGKLASIGLEPRLDSAGNSWATIRGESDRTVQGNRCVLG